MKIIGPFDTYWWQSLIIGHLIRPAECRSCPTDLAIAVLSADTNAMITNRMRFDDDDTSRKAELADKS